MKKENEENSFQILTNLMQSSSLHSSAYKFSTSACHKK